jgi:hypothetical protein
MFGQGVAQMTVGSSTRPANNGKHSTAALVTAAICLTATLLVVSGEPEPYHPEWAIVTTELAASDWPLVVAARYDAINHFILVDVRPGISEDAALRLAWQDLRPLLDGVDATVGSALFEAPDRVVARGEDCAIGT